ncbi:MAG: hypothetical protein JSW16_08480 [Dehalococcoidales bacterium]|nr:MAG: hypothetical protein JSW16_08480 [Dehalococcoidales bacterium]
MVRGLAARIPQIIAIVSISRDGKLNLKKAVMKHLGIQKVERLFLDKQNEILISAVEGNGEELPALAGNKLRLPEEILNKLDLSSNSMVGFIQREHAVAIKKVDIIEEEGERTGLFDIETPNKITRKAMTTPMPEQLLPRLEEQYKDLKLNYNVRSFLRGRQTVEAWQARKVLGILEASDEGLRVELISERLEKQDEDGSWAKSVTVTARNLREIAALGMTGEDEEIKRAVQWLLDRPQSRHNPGMWFLTDELVEEQQDIVRRRIQQTRGNRPRFRKRPASEIKMVKAGDDLIRNSCGPRIMWPNALVLEALLSLGYEDSERVQVCIRTLMVREWCECGYSHGFSDSRRKEPYSTEEIENIEKACIVQYRYGGLRGLKELRENRAYAGTQRPRVARIHRDETDEYALLGWTSTQNCEWMTTRALSLVKNSDARRVAEAHLWRFTGLQNTPDGKFSSPFGERWFSKAGYLEIIAGYDMPVAKVAIFRSIPWILENQNEDGSWGEEPERESATLAVIKALRNVKLI